ncbi:Kre9p KNAG_0C02360 [Huiozyma naganishii CBS 8797]|uniref:Uncharacterized protein n=1 Tax=Huiozyma naganishii (strain ATCC MYA-139 / BCRC 22969 / CBS 8797 / KCTC 17520 / NBRC 10181 / NCYC 3082 / Yp74L-3) TaxID=1071383 RepID=J7RWG7_HUIN7|nr:hypothetical protein KNAG_0C02360 [Kazachstania naganishii CBS 8797]CCK69347.1 hypothetical protein KNAG_0C02360 [Kazachstania naganishii CBS 8797]
MFAVDAVFVRVVLIVAAFIGVVRADVAIVAPEKGKTFSPQGGTVDISVKWADDGNYPQLDKVTYYTLSLCSGPNSQINCFFPIQKKLAPSALEEENSGGNHYYSFDATFSAGVVGSGQFYLQVFAFVENQGYTIHYSPRFVLTGMSGQVTTFTYSDTIQPAGQTSIQTTTTRTADTSIDSASFSVTYTKQTGTRRFAPMQSKPGTRVTATSWSRKYPTSAVTYYSTFRKSLDQLTTITPGISYLITSDFNYATPAPMPSDNGGWYNPSKRLSLTARKISL